ncbi:MAG: transcription antitermination factor NusB [Candidatus Aminicenantes bacterium]|nr:transcription antitermination factor NusB [Candidatus Aminicenantes bacterium]MCK5005252.1 transcription antitermination factor NusB [Candidatus Aminicenantes bacterium]
MFRVKYSREVILKLLYQIDVTNQFDVPPAEILKTNSNFFNDINEVELEFITDIITRIIKDKETIDNRISKDLIGWRLERLTPIDRNLIRMGIAESMKTGNKIIVIDDIVRIAKKYGGDESYKIINAVLDKVIE